MSYSGDFVEYYDKIFAKKNYSQEINYIARACEKYGTRKLKNILDFGCGTGTHALLLGREKDIDASLVGYDYSSDMVRVANNKIKDDNCKFYDNKDDISGKFDLFISMFYVVNHLINLDDLNGFFSFASSKLEDGGLLIFDCWNAIAAIKEPPYSSDRERYSDDNIKIITSCFSNTNLMNSSVHMKNSVKIIKGDEPIHSFSYELQHTLWTPHIVKQLLKEHNFELICVNKTYEINKGVNEKDYKMVFICKYRGNK
jgi:cyclopropane fatty-acyl-phospholipid synthase-like methyltransferase